MRHARVVAVGSMFLFATAAADEAKKPASPNQPRPAPDRQLPKDPLPAHWHLQPISAKAKASFDLGVRWETVEGTWRSTWIRRGATNTFDGAWTSQVGHGPFKGTLTVSDDGNTVVISRADVDGSGNTCVYRASLDSIPSQWTAGVFNGTSSCTNTSHTMVYPWSARVVKQ